MARGPKRGLRMLSTWFSLMKEGSEKAGHELPFHIYRVCLVQPYIKRRVHRGLASALVVLEFVDNYGVGIKKRKIQGMLRNQSGIGHDRCVAGAFSIPPKLDLVMQMVR